MEKGHYGEYSGNAKHSRVTASNYKATERDDAAHIDYLKRDVLYDDHHGHSDISMTADEKHISKLAGDMKYDKTHHGMSRESADLKYMPIEDDMKRGMSRESSELKYMPIEDDMKRGMSREESLQTKHLRSQVQNDYPRPMPAEAPRRFTETAYKRLSPDYPGKGMPTSEYVQDKYEEFRDGPKVERYTGDKSKTLIGFEARAGVSRKGSKPDYIDIDGDGNKKESMKEASDGMSRKSRSERLRGRAVVYFICSIEKLVDTSVKFCLLYTSPSPRDGLLSRMPSSA